MVVCGMMDTSPIHDWSEDDVHAWMVGPFHN